jgi:3-hydroxyacyl-[acyl-carrier-protein] dehydratase
MDGTKMQADDAGLETMKGTFLFDPEDRIYDTHFPGHPVVPGSMIVRAFMLAAERLASIDARCTMEDFRFKRFVAPGVYSYEIVMTDGRLKCRLYDSQSVVTTGTIRPWS